ncbi:Uncharacterized membrane protein YqhA [Rheinheimera pacifica]|uniref:Uncharacterized membrane protein YqhA n=1 Tax=Rheinheimera pacifica TaxID=173990 RepID=A0A1H6J1P9_9GAMM|nr:YqhA family protein [Rheinheimera pacifica]SEH54497.1 Uncharacterized membrane protein YqhA [Rheinheimera pacifica]
MVEHIFKSSRFLVLVTVLVCAVAAVLLYAASVNIVFHVVLDTVSSMPQSADGGKRLAVKLLKILDTLLIAVTFQIIAVALYRLFIANQPLLPNSFLTSLQINNFHDLKVTLIQVAMVILVVLFLEQAVEVGATLETLYFGLAAAVVIVAGVYATVSMKEH